MCSRQIAADFGEIAGGRHDDAGFALDGLDEKGASVGGDGAAEGFGVAVGDLLEAGGEWAEAVAVLLFRREADDGDGATVKIVGGDEDLGLAGGDAFDGGTPLARGLERGLDCLGAGVHG